MIAVIFGIIGTQVWAYCIICDRQSSIHLAKNPIYHTRTKHIKVRYRFIILTSENGILTFEKI